MKIKALFTALLFSVLSYAQNGIIRGTVYEDETSEALFYANAQIPSTGAVAFTDFDGNFELSLEPGTYDLEISFLGLATLTISDLKVEAGKVTAFENLRLMPSTNELMTVTVTASAMRNTESALLDVKKKSATVMDGISAQNFKRVGDGNAAAAVTRVPGVSIQGGKYVFVRGLGDRYTKTQLMRMDIPGLDPDRNSLQMDIFPTNILQNIVVLKTLTADLPADFSGGLVNIELVDFPTKKTLNINSSLGYTPGMHLVQGLGHQGSMTDFLGFDSGFRTNPLQSQYIYSGIPNPALDDPTTTELTQSFAPVLAAQSRLMPGNGSLGISGGNQIKKDNGKTIGYNGSFSYKANTNFFGSMGSDSTRMYEQNFYRKGNLPNQYNLLADRTQKGSLAVSNVFMSGLFGYSIKDDNDKYRFTLMHLQNGETRTGRFIETASIENSFEGLRDNLEYSERSITSALFNGQHSRKDNDLKIDWRIAPTFSRIADKDIRSTSFRTEDNAFVIAPGETGGSYTETIDVIIPASTNLGSFTMRAKTNWNNPVPEDACAPTNYGETEDYTVNIVSMLNTSDFSPLNNTKLTILDKGDKQYEAVLTTAYDGPAYIAIYNLKGQQLKFKKIVKSSVDSYVVRLDMSQVSTGMYIIRIGGKIGGSYFTEKFIVK